MRMKSRIFAVLAIVISLSIAGIVQADEAPPVITHVYFEKDGIPYTEPVRYTVSCYAYRENDTRSTFSSGKGGAGTVSEVFSYSATCNGFGCAVYEPYYHVFMPFARCDLHGQTRGSDFTITNFSSLPFTFCGTPLDNVVLLRDPGEETLCYLTPEYYACRSPHRNESSEAVHAFWSSCDPRVDAGCFPELMPNGIPLRLTSRYSTVRNGTTMDLNAYVQYLESCDPAADPDCPGALVDGWPLKEMTGIRPCLSGARKDTPCDTFLVRANASLMFTDRELLESTHDFTAGPMVGRICESRWTIPADAPAGETPARSYPYLQRSPVESLYCGIISILRMRC
jgi:hypothetical protein